MIIFKYSQSTTTYLLTILQFMNTTSLSWSTRIKGFIICFVLGFVLSMIGTALLFGPKGLLLFCVFYTLGNITSMISTLFLMGPFKQLKKMFNSNRYIATIFALLFMALTLYSGLYLRKKGLSIIFCICQFFALIWYSISYIPYAREAVKKTLTTFVA